MYFSDINENKLSYFQQHAFINDMQYRVYKMVNIRKWTKSIIGLDEVNFFIIGHIKYIRGRLTKKR